MVLFEGVGMFILIPHAAHLTSLRRLFIGLLGCTSSSGGPPLVSCVLECIDLDGSKGSNARLSSRG